MPRTQKELAAWRIASPRLSVEVWPKGASRPNNPRKLVKCLTALLLSSLVAAEAAEEVSSNKRKLLKIQPVITYLLFDNEPDRDGDGVPDSRDAFPDDPSESRDDDNDGVGDNSDLLIGGVDTLSVDVNQSLTIDISDLLANDQSSDPEYQLKINGVGSATNGVVSFDEAKQTISFTPNQDYVGSDASFYYQLTAEGQSQYEQVKVNIRITEPFQLQVLERPNVGRSGNELNINWNACQRADGYRVLFGPSGQRPNHYLTNKPGLTITEPSQTGRFDVIVECYDALGNSVFSPRVQVEVI